MHFLFAFLFSLSMSFASEPSRVWGRIIKARHLNYNYFVTYEEKGEFHAYPIETNNKELIAAIEKNISQLVNVTGTLKTVELKGDGREQRIPVFIPEKLSPLTLSQLSVGDQKVMDPKYEDKKKEAYNGGGIRINDTLANTLIITTGAIMIGSAILNSMNKK